MDDYAASFLNAPDEPAIPEVEAEAEDREDEGQHEAGPDSPKQARGLRGGIFRAANLQDKLLEK
jgi:hypothetical protein